MTFRPSLPPPSACIHGGASFDWIGANFECLDRRHQVVNADVLDAWFTPSPKVLEALNEDLSWLLRTSPPAQCDGLREVIAEWRGVSAANILPGAGSSDLIFRSFLHWLTPESRALILDPTYGEYAHVLEQVIGCTADRLKLSAHNNFAVDLAQLDEALTQQYDLVVLVNPNSPTGQHIPRQLLEPVLRRAPAQTRIWIDETYTDYLGAGESLEQSAADSENLIICKSMSKVYALSGARVAYLCAGTDQLESLQRITPPWIVSLPAQLAAVRALQDPTYYQARYRETATLRESLENQLRTHGLQVIPGIANFVLCFLPTGGVDAATMVMRCREQGVFIRDASNMGSDLGTYALRIAVGDAFSNARVLQAMTAASFRTHALGVPPQLT